MAPESRQSLLAARQALHDASDDCMATARKINARLESGEGVADLIALARQSRVDSLLVLTRTIDVARRAGTPWEVIAEATGLTVADLIQRYDYLDDEGAGADITSTPAPVRPLPHPLIPN